MSEQSPRGLRPQQASGYEKDGCFRHYTYCNHSCDRLLDLILLIASDLQAGTKGSEGGTIGGKSLYVPKGVSGPPQQNK